MSKPPNPIPAWRKIAMATWRRGKDPMISAAMDIEASRLLEYIDQVRAATAEHVTPAHLVGRAVGKVMKDLPGLNGRIVLGSFVPSPTIDCSFVVSLRTDPTIGAEAAATDISGAVVRRVNEKPPWVIARELTDHVARIRRDDDPLFARVKEVVQRLPPLLIGPIAEGIGLLTDGLQLSVPLLGLEARPFGSVSITNIGTYGLDTVFPPMPAFCHLPIAIIVGAVTDKVLARDGKPVVRPVLPLAFELDHRFVDGYQAATMARLFRAYLDDPAAYDPVPTPTPTSKRRRVAVRANGASRASR